jgi:hypothetical protein
MLQPPSPRPVPFRLVCVVSRREETAKVASSKPGTGCPGILRACGTPSRSEHRVQATGHLVRPDTKSSRVRVANYPFICIGNPRKKDRKRESRQETRRSGADPLAGGIAISAVPCRMRLEVEIRPDEAIGPGRAIKLTSLTYVRCLVALTLCVTVSYSVSWR